VHNCISVNNGEYDLWVDAGSLVDFISDYNLFWNSTAQAAIKIDATTCATLAAYKLSAAARAALEGGRSEVREQPRRRTSGCSPARRRSTPDRRAH
jgi:hypothetical protein